MFHLFKSVYVETDRAMLERTNHINFSEYTGYKFVYEAQAPRFGEQLGYAKSLDDLTPEEFLKIMMSALRYQDKVYIYCDSESYNRMYSILLKSLFPNITFETFKYFFLCLKSMYEIKRLRNNIKDLSIEEGVIINLETTRRLYDLKDPLVPAFQRVIVSKEESLSLEWRIIRMLVTGQISTIPAVINNLIDRMVIANAKMALEVWSNMVTDPDQWDFAGTDIDLLLNSETTSAGCPGLGDLGNSLFNTSFAYQADVDDEWRVSVLNKCIEIYERMNRQTHVTRMKRLLPFVDPNYVVDSMEKCLDFIKVTFTFDKDQVQLAQADYTKYNSPIIRHVLKQDVDTLKQMMEGAGW